MSTDTTKLIARQYIDGLWNRGDLATADTILAADFVENIPFPGQEPGPEGYKQLVTQFRTVFPDLHFTIEELIAEGDRVMVRWSGRGTHRAELAGIPATGKAITMTGIDIFQITNGQITERWGERDTLSLMQQLGAIPS